MTFEDFYDKADWDGLSNLFVGAGLMKKKNGPHDPERTGRGCTGLIRQDWGLDSPEFLIISLGGVKQITSAHVTFISFGRDLFFARMNFL